MHTYVHKLVIFSFSVLLSAPFLTCYNKILLKTTGKPLSKQTNQIKAFSSGNNWAASQFVTINTEVSKLCFTQTRLLQHSIRQLSTQAASGALATATKIQRSFQSKVLKTSKIFPQSISPSYSILMQKFTIFVMCIYLHIQYNGISQQLPGVTLVSPFKNILKSFLVSVENQRALSPAT